MHRFEYRYPRFCVDIPAQLAIANETLSARCIDISTRGMRLNLRRTVVPGSVATVSLRHRDQNLHLKVRVAHSDTEESGLEFVYDSVIDRSAVMSLIASLTTPHSGLLMSVVPRHHASPGSPAMRP